MSMNYRQAVKLITENGGVPLRSGGNHDLFIMPWGTVITVPRHAGDFSPGVENDIKKKATGAKR